MAPRNVGSVASRQKKNVSKKKKVAWRKYCDIGDVETYLEGVRLEERVGVRFDSAEDALLFFEDNKPESSPGNNIEPTVIKSKAERKLVAQKKLESGPTCFQILEARSCVPDPVIKRNRIRTATERRDPLVKRIEEKRKARGILTVKEKSQIRNWELHESKLNALQPDRFSKDLWVEENKKTDLDWLDSNTFRHTMNNIRKNIKKVPSSITGKTSVLPPVEPPHPGASYNPSYADHKALLQSIIEKEEGLIKEEKHLIRVTDKMFSTITPQQHERIYLKEMSQGLTKPHQSKNKEKNVGSEYRTVNPPTLDKKKTKKTRRNLKLAKKEEQIRKLKAIEKKKVADIYKLKSITEHLNEAEVKLLERQEIMKEKQKTKALGTKRLSKLKFQEHEPEFNMPSDLRGNLRSLKPEGNILYDRFKSMQKRNILQPSEFQRIRNRPKKKVYVKESHKIDYEKYKTDYENSKIDQ